MHFQYPRSDRAHCNDRHGEHRRRFQDLSVSSVGSSPLQLWISRISHGATISFQYPRSDRAHCNFDVEAGEDDGEYNFQYPRSDRAHCNLPDEDRIPGPHLELSVSSVGSSPLQPCLLSRLDRGATSSFSILGRIEPTATARAQLPTHLRVSRLSVSSVGSSPLQPPTLPPSAGSVSPFSILGRIEPTATPQDIINGPPQHHHFQYPRSDRAHCNSSPNRSRWNPRSPPR